MKVFAIATINQTIPRAEVQRHLPDEVPATLQLYLDGWIEQFWFRERLGPIFLMNVDSVEHAHSILQALPLVVDGVMTFELMPVTPLSPLSVLIKKAH